MDQREVTEMQIRLKKKCEPFPMALLIEADPDKNVIATYLDKSICMVAETEYEIIGVYMLLPIAEETIELKNVAVDESHRGKGYGKQLIQHAIETARLRGYRTLEVGTANSSTEQMRLYQTCGFRMDTIIHDFFIHHYNEPIYEHGVQCIDMVRFRMDLT